MRPWMLQCASQPTQNLLKVHPPSVRPLPTLPTRFPASRRERPPHRRSPRLPWLPFYQRQRFMLQQRKVRPPPVHRLFHRRQRPRLQQRPHPLTANSGPPFQPARVSSRLTSVRSSSLQISNLQLSWRRCSLQRRLRPRSHLRNPRRHRFLKIRQSSQKTRPCPRQPITRAWLPPPIQPSIPYRRRLPPQRRRQFQRCNLPFATPALRP